jgi:hypothetical protein
MLREVVLPELENSPLYDNAEIIWQQDSARPHYSLRVRKFLNNSFPEWIGQRGTADCTAPRSCGLTPYDFSVWGIMKNEVFFFQRPTDLGTPTNDH